MKVLIIEDETAASENLIAMLQEIDPQIEVLKVLESVQQTVRWLNSNPAPDLIFMDIHLSDGSAFTLFQEMEHRRWMRFHQMYNWQYAPVRDNALRRHPLLLPYEQLSVPEQRKDAYAWEMLGRLGERTEQT